MPTDRPHILLILTDQQQAAMLGSAGHPALQTPAMDRLAAEGVRFSRAFCTSPQCSPSRSSLMTGLYPHHTTVMGNIPETTFGPAQLPTHLPTLGSLLQAAGYRTAYFGKWHLGTANDSTANPLAYGFEQFVPPTRLGSEVEGEEGLATAAAAHIAGYHDPQPLFLVASFNDPHGVYALPRVRLPLATDGIRLPESFDDDLARKPAAQRLYRDEDQPAALPLDEPTARRYLAWYATMVERADGYLDRILTALDDRSDLAQRTVVIFASDHGDLACAHRLPFKGPCMYDELMRVPLLLRGPGIAAGKVCDEMVTLADLLPTICDLTGTRPPAVDGASLAPLLHPAALAVPWRQAVIGQYHGKQRWCCPIRMLRTTRHKLVVYREGARELYDLRHDPDERCNLAGQPGHAALEADLAHQLSAWMTANDDHFDRSQPTDRFGHVK